ncbi:hypothetical protein BOX15_Mlig003896g5 [Macrostomum lignano]|uniref:Palmitoyltransferase n=1 Tax=Macrostomum lignano TaxID=282301 RepID=A0A267FR29_9PLAT|nr:hypothetical protein BOX15_Mlig003896g2 [Macrostomum lignano]PAA75489.1 hypothetical protein BOX15_Mlig003896g5 [Macrostomum lignano]
MNKCLLICIKISRAIPLVFISLILSWSYYAYVVAMCIYAIPSTSVGEKVVLIVFYHIFFGMFVWAYIQTILTKPLLVPSEFKLSQTDLANIQIVEGNESESSSRWQDYLLGVIAERHLPMYTRGSFGSNGGNSGSTSQGRFIRLCDSCQLIKPDRAHHCSTCGVCLLKMDHHCPWVNNCVGLHNYKYFLLFLVYGALYCFYVGGSSAKYFVAFWTAGIADVEAYRFHVLFVFFVAWLFSLSLVFLAGYHAFLTLRNRTTLESSRAPILESGPDYRAFDLGFKRNFRQVFGNRWQLWPLPVKSWLADGVNWEQRIGSPSWDQRPPSAVSANPILLLPEENYRPHDADIEANGRAPV